MATYEENILTDIRLFLWFSKLYGFFSPKLEISTTDDKKYLSLNKCHYVYSIALQMGTCVMTYLSFQSFCEYSYEITNGGLFFAISTLTEFIGSLFVYVTCIHSKVYVIKVQKLWEKMYNTEKELQHFCIKINHKRLRILSVLCVLFYTVIASISLVMFLVFKTSFYTVAFSTHYGCMSHGFINGQQVLSYFIIDQMFKELNHTAEKSYLCSNHKRCLGPRQLLDIAKFHQQLCEIAREVNSATSLQHILQHAIMFCLLTISCFMSVVSIMNDTYRLPEMAHFMWSAVSILAVICLIGVSHRCMDRVSTYIIHTSQIPTVLQKLIKLPQTSYNMLSEFGEQNRG